MNNYYHHGLGKLTWIANNINHTSSGRDDIISKPLILN